MSTVSVSGPFNGAWVRPGGLVTGTHLSRLSQATLGIAATGLLNIDAAGRISQPVSFDHLIGSGKSFHRFSRDSPMKWRFVPVLALCAAFASAQYGDLTGLKLAKPEDGDMKSPRSRWCGGPV
jgi:hypothetical protein